MVDFTGVIKNLPSDAVVAVCPFFSKDTNAPAIGTPAVSVTFPQMVIAIEAVDITNK
jgi:hypothetical protein